MHTARSLISRFKQTPLYKGLAGLSTSVLMKGGLLIVLVLAGLVAAILPRFVYRAPELAPTIDQPPSETTMYRHPLTGAGVYEPVDLPGVFSVMIDNHEDAWPPAGIEQAFLVIEAPVEAGIPRMLAFFAADVEVEQIGPVRSARPYYLDWAAEFDALYVHVGGSDAALDQLATGGTFDLNQYWWGEYFWRANGNRFAPHNVFTSTEDLRAFYELREQAGVVPTRLYDVWAFKDPVQAQRENRLQIDFWAPMYVVDWEYDASSRQYVRSQAGAPHMAQSGARVVADNVAVVVTDIKILDQVGRRSVRTVGEGEGYVLQDGHAIEATWRKPSASERLKFFDRATGEEIVMNAGVTWIEVVGDFDNLVIE